MTVNPQLMPLIGRFAEACDEAKMPADLTASINQSLAVLGATMSTSPELEQSILDLLKFHTRHFKGTGGEANTQSILRVVK